MKRICVLLLVAFVWFPSLTSAQGTDPELKDLVRKIADHSIRLEEQNKATQQQLALIERQMEKRFELLQEDMDKRFDQTTWILGIMAAAIMGLLGLVYKEVKKVAVVGQKIETKLDRGEFAILKKTVQAIKELLESKGDKILIEP